MIYGLSAAMYGEINIEKGRVFKAPSGYPVVRMHDAPTIETHIVNSGEAWGGAGNRVRRESHQLWLMRYIRQQALVCDSCRYRAMTSTTG